MSTVRPGVAEIAPTVADEILRLHGDALQQLYRQCEDQLGANWQAMSDKPAESVATTLAALWHAAASAALSLERAGEQPLPALDANGRARLRELVSERVRGTPLAQLTGIQTFMGIEFMVSADALIPRVETELLGYAALAKVRECLAQQGRAPVVLDVCTGSGNLALALASHEPGAQVRGADLSTDAVALAKRNAMKLGLGERVTFLEGDLLAPFDTAEFRGRVDVIVCNPPYISSAKVDAMREEIIQHEPRLAFDGGPLGIRILQRLVNEAPQFLRAGGWLAFEVGLGQGRGMRKRLEQLGVYDEIAEIVDAQGQVRALAACANGRVP
ncbi:MAG: peptide chain release factor N(5)-glutamine methyltransferase [Betaproteobacteria bacterium]